MQDETTRKQIAQLVLNQGKLVEKIKELDFLVKGGEALRQRLQERIVGLETALIGAGVLNQEGLDLHQSFKVEEATEETVEEKMARDKHL